MADIDIAAVPLFRVPGQTEGCPATCDGVGIIDVLAQVVGAGFEADGVGSAASVRAVICLGYVVEQDAVFIPLDFLVHDFFPFMMRSNEIHAEEPSAQASAFHAGPCPAEIHGQAAGDPAESPCECVIMLIPIIQGDLQQALLGVQDIKRGVCDAALGDVFRQGYTVVPGKYVPNVSLRKADPARQISRIDGPAQARLDIRLDLPCNLSRFHGYPVSCFMKHPDYTMRTRGVLDVFKDGGGGLNHKGYGSSMSSFASPYTIPPR